MGRTDVSHRGVRVFGKHTYYADMIEASKCFI